MLIARSPLRVTLGGGGTDLPSYYKKKEGFLIKCGPVCKRPNLEQTLAGRIRTKGSDVCKMLFFCVVACQKREPKRGQEK